MSLAIDSKEELHLRMTELEKKLKDSEEERRKLEKTCDVLFKAFREEQRMHYKALNNRYEKFLQDCNIRRKRNDIILRSLCRVEDKAKSIFAKTERLKLLRDHYVSYLKQNEFHAAEVPRLKTSFSFLRDRVSNEAAQKSVHWKTPVVAEVQEYKIGKDLNGAGENPKPVPDFVEKEIFEKEIEKNSSAISKGDDPKGFLSERLSGWNVDGHLPNLTVHGVHEREINRSPEIPDRKPEIQRTPVAEGSPSSNVTPWIVDGVRNRSTSYLECGGIDNGRENGDAVKLESSNLKQVKALRERGVLKHRESIDKLKIALEDYGEINGGKDDDKTSENFLRNVEKKSGQAIVEKDETETSEKADGSKINTALDPYNVGSVQGMRGNEDGETVSGDVEATKGEPKVYPKGLDGVDYENETYPESYYEQPSKIHDYSNLASNVILEEDEYELYADQQEASDDVTRNEPIPKGFSDRFLVSPVSPRICESRSETDKKMEGRAIEGDDDDDDNDDDELADNSNLIGNADRSESRYSEREIDRFDKSNVEKNAFANPEKSHLLRLLESDSESFQIEHGDEMNSGNEDSDFDFSFRQNPE